MAVWRNERGEGGIKNIILLVLVLYGIFCAIKVVGVRGNDRAIQQKLEELLRFAEVNRYKEVKDIRYQVDLLLTQYEIPIKVEDVKIEDLGREWHVSFSYDRVLPLIAWTYRKHIDVDARADK